MMMMVMIMIMTMTLLQVITRLDVGSESSGLGSDRGSEGSDSPPLLQGPQGERIENIYHTYTYVHCHIVNCTVTFR